MKKITKVGLLLSFFFMFVIQTKAFTIIENGSFRLSAISKWSTSDGKNYAQVSWDAVPDLSQAGYQLYQSSDGQSWENRSMKYGKKIKVLNIYPDIEASNTLKDWMESLDLKDSSGDELIEVTPITNVEFGKDPKKYLMKNGEYLYDVLMFGSWDSNNGKTISQETAQELKKYEATGRGILFGHDTVYQEFIKQPFMDNFGQNLGVGHPAWIPLQPNNHTHSKYWTGSTKVKIIEDGYLMKYPFEMENGQILTIPYSHNIEFQLKDVGQTWMEFIEPSGLFSNAIYNDQTYRGGWYLKTNNNLAMIQTGHSNGASTLDERKVIANTLYNLAQVSLDTRVDDYSVKDDVAPAKPTIKLKDGGSYQDYTLEASAVDYGKKYWWYIEAATKHQGVKKSDVVQEEIKSDLQGYLYTINSSSDYEPNVQKDAYGNVTNLTQTVNPDSTRAITIPVANAKNQTDYLHIRAVDRANNVGAVQHIPLRDLVPEFEVTEKYITKDKQVIKPETKTYVKRNTAYQKKAPSIEHYDLKNYQVDTSTQIEAQEGDQVSLANVLANHEILFYYELTNYPVTIQALDDRGTAVFPEKVVQKTYGSSFDYQVPILKNYRYVETNISGENPQTTEQITIKKITGPLLLQVRYQRTLTVNLQIKGVNQGENLVVPNKIATILTLKGEKSTETTQRYQQTIQIGKVQQMMIDRTSDTYELAVQMVDPAYYTQEKWQWGTTASGLNQESTAEQLKVSNQPEIWITTTFKATAKPKRFSSVTKESDLPVQKK